MPLKPCFSLSSPNRFSFSCGGMRSASRSAQLSEILSQLLFQQHQLYIWYSVKYAGHDIRFGIAQLLIQSARRRIFRVRVHPQHRAAVFPRQRRFRRSANGINAGQPADGRLSRPLLLMDVRINRRNRVDIFFSALRICSVSFISFLPKKICTQKAPSHRLRA